MLCNQMIVLLAICHLFQLMLVLDRMELYLLIYIYRIQLIFDS